MDIAEIKDILLIYQAQPAREERHECRSYNPPLDLQIRSGEEKFANLREESRQQNAHVLQLCSNHGDRLVREAGCPVRKVTEGDQKKGVRRVMPTRHSLLIFPVPLQEIGGPPTIVRSSCLDMCIPDTPYEIPHRQKAA